jgi:hypothetical protein
MDANELLTRLDSLQSKGTAIYPAGVFPSQRYQPHLRIVREDDNVFFTACIVHILQHVDAKLHENERSLARSICERAILSYPLYRNKDGLDTYNFWQTRPSRHFPNGRWMHRFDHFRIPDDIDDTALVMLTERASKERVGALREKLKGHANLAYRQAKNTLKEYRNLKVYSTFIGKNMYIDMDVCALSNLMRLILPYFSDELNEYDRDSLHFICQSVRKEQHLKSPYRVAPQYSTTPLILYHLARLLPLLPEEYCDIKSTVIGQMQEYHGKLGIGMNRLLLENELLKLGVMNTATESYPINLASDQDFFYFIAGMFTAYEGEVPQHLTVSPLSHLRYRCEAFNTVLLLENAVLHRTAQ